MKRLSVVAAVAIVALASFGCYTTRLAGPGVLASRPPQRVWLTLADHSTVVVQSPRISGDTLRGLVDGVRRVFLLSDATLIQIRQFAPARTVALELLGGVIVAAIVAESRTNAAPAGLGNCCRNPQPGCPPIPCPLLQ